VEIGRWGRERIKVHGRVADATTLKKKNEKIKKDWQTLMYDIEATGRGNPICALYVLDDVVDEVGEFEYGELVAVAQVDRSCLARVHECDQAVD
jgi:hypothetical protein